MGSAGSYIKGARVNVLGLTFKENCADLRNSKVADVINQLKSCGAEVVVHDPFADPQEAMHEYGVRLSTLDELHARRRHCGSSIAPGVAGAGGRGLSEETGQGWGLYRCEGVF